MKKLFTIEGYTTLHTSVEIEADTEDDARMMAKGALTAEIENNFGIEVSNVVVTYIIEQEDPDPDPDPDPEPEPVKPILVKPKERRPQSEPKPKPKPKPRTTINLWMEGFRATGEYGEARFCGSYFAEDLKEAVIKHKECTLANNPMLDEKLFDLENLTYWGCRFFDNEADARKSFG